MKTDRGWLRTRCDRKRCWHDDEDAVAEMVLKKDILLS